MEKKIRKDVANFESTLSQCVNYAAYSSPEDASIYMDDIKDVVVTATTDFRKAWKTLADTGVFHDCMGKVVKVTAAFLIVETEY